MICPTTVEIIEFPEVPKYNKDEVLLLFPQKDAKLLKDIKDLDKIKKLVVIDSQWQTTKKMLNHENLCDLNCVIINTHDTLFWRYQPKSVDEKGLATIEAIYYFYKEYYFAAIEKSPTTIYDGRFDDLLYFFSYNYNLIQKHYKSKKKEFTKKKNYIK